MKSNRWKRMKENVFLKILGMILFALSLSGIIFVLYISSEMSGFAKSNEVQAVDENSYYQTDGCVSIMKSDALQVGSIADDVYYGSIPTMAERQAKWDQLDQWFSPESSNAQYTLERKAASGDFTEVRSNIQNDVNYGVEGTWLISEDDGLYISDSEDTAQVRYRVTIAVKDPVTFDDGYYSSYNIFVRYGSYQWLIPAALIFFAIISAGSVIYECAACGHKRGTEGIHETWFDRIPYEIMTAVLLFASLFWFLATADRSDHPLWLSIAVVPSAVIALLWLMSTVVRMKSGHFGRHTVTRVLVNRYRNIPAVWNLWSIAMTVLFVLITFYLAAVSGRMTVIVALSLVDIFLILSICEIVWSMHQILQGSSELAQGNLDYHFSEDALNHLHGPFRKQAENLNDISEGMKIAVQEKMKSERLKTELITNVSHDLRTPLTSIISYADLLQKEHTEEQEQEYLNGLSRQSKRLNRLCTDLIDASKASTGNVEVNPEKVNIRELIEQSEAEYEERFARGNLSIVNEIHPDTLSAYVDGRLLWRVLSNLFSNVSKYTLEGTRVYVDARANDKENILITIKNISKEKLNISAEELMERFVRGDRSRHTQGSGLGLDIARSLTELMHGSFHITINGDMFITEISLPAYY